MSYWTALEPTSNDLRPVGTGDDALTKVVVIGLMMAYRHFISTNRKSTPN